MSSHSSSQSLEFVFGATAQELETFVDQWNYSTFVGTALWETYTPHANLTLLVDLLNRRNIATTIILNSWCQLYQETFNKLNCNVLYFDFFLWRTYNELVIKNKNPVSTYWNPSADKFLFLTGKPQKPNRIRLLHKFSQHQLLDHCVWSLYVHPGNSAMSRRCLSELTDIEFQEFVQRYSSNPDGADIVFQPRDLHYGGIPYDVEMFNNTKFQVISETSMYNSHPFFTEKTWMTILNCLPFIIAGDVNSNQALRDMGFRTFDHCVPDKKYDSVWDIEQRLDAIVDHTKFWLEGNIDNDKVAEDVIYNYNNLLSVAVKSKHKLEQELTRAGFDNNIDNIITTLDDITNT
jgi:hypothetical protein